MDSLAISPLRDQRTMVGAAIHASVDEVEAAWQVWADENGIVARRRTGDFSTDLRKSRAHVSGYVSAGKWLATCPRCNDGIACWLANPRGCCLGCGTIYQVDFPPESETTVAVAALAARANVDRNWLPWQTPAEALHADNAAQGLLAIGAQEQLHKHVSLSAVRDVLGADAVQALLDAQGPAA